MRGLICLIALALIPVLHAALNGVSLDGRKIYIMELDPLVGKATKNLTSLYLQGPCNNVLVSYQNMTREIGIGCDNDLFNINAWRIGDWTSGRVLGLTPAWPGRWIEDENCAFLAPEKPSEQSYGSFYCFSFSGTSQTNLAPIPYPYKGMVSQDFTFSDSYLNIGIYSHINGDQTLIWGKSTIDNSTNLVLLDRDPVLTSWIKLIPFAVPISQLGGSSSYSHPALNNVTVIELKNSVMVLDSTRLSLSAPISFCQGHTKLGSSAFDPYTQRMYSMVGCNSGSYIVTFDIFNKIVKHMVRYDSNGLNIQGLYYSW